VHKNLLRCASLQFNTMDNIRHTSN
jgi:hypothetical protein